jgi:hypothetical protein
LYLLLTLFLELAGKFLVQDLKEGHEAALGLLYFVLLLSGATLVHVHHGLLHYLLDEVSGLPG